MWVAHCARAGLPLESPDVQLARPPLHGTWLHGQHVRCAGSDGRWRSCAPAGLLLQCSCWQSACWKSGTSNRSYGPLPTSSYGGRHGGSCPHFVRRYDWGFDHEVQCAQGFDATCYTFYNEDCRCLPVPPSRPQRAWLAQAASSHSTAFTSLRSALRLGLTAARGSSRRCAALQT